MASFPSGDTTATTTSYSWLFGLDDEVRSWAAANRPLVAAVLVLSAIVYAMYDWLEDKER